MKQSVVGPWMIEELREHGYNVSPGTLDPLLRRMEKNGWLRSEADEKAGPKARCEYFLLRRDEALREVLTCLAELQPENPRERAQVIR